MKRALLPLVVVIVLAAMPAGTAVAETGTSQMATITVTVVDQNGNPIANAELSATWDGGSASAVTKSNGKAFLDVPRGADVTIEVGHSRYTRNLPYEITDATEGDVTIDVAAKSSASVTVADGNGPVPDARVQFWQDRELIASGVTDSDGKFTTGIIEAGDYRVTVSKSGYYRKGMQLDVRGETAHDVRIKHGTVTVTFNVLDQNFDPAKPVAGATITGDAIGSVKTQANGVQRISLPVNSEVEVTVEKQGYRTVTRSISVKESDRRINVSTRKQAAISFGFLNDRVVVGEQVHVEITDQYGDPVPGSTVYLDGKSAGKTNEDGVLLVTIEEAGEHTFYAESGSLASEKHTVTGVRPMETASATPTATPAEPESEPTTETPAAIQSGVVSLPGMPDLHVKSAGIGLAVGAVLAFGVSLLLRLRGAKNPE